MHRDWYLLKQPGLLGDTLKAVNCSPGSGEQLLSPVLHKQDDGGPPNRARRREGLGGLRNLEGPLGCNLHFPC
jgi:hypothetical protein